MSPRIYLTTNDKMHLPTTVMIINWHYDTVQIEILLCVSTMQFGSLTNETLQFEDNVG